MPLLSQDELEQIPTLNRLLVKILLKLPNPNLPVFIIKRLPEFDAILWALIVPVLVALYVPFNIWLFPFLTLLLGFPLNVIIGSIIPAMIFLFFLRMQLERTILWWKTIHEEPREWQTSKRVEELIEILNRQQKRKKS